MKIKPLKIFSIFIMLFIFLFSGCSQSDSSSKNNSTTEFPNLNEATTQNVPWSIEKSPLNGIPILENKSIYKNDRDDEVITLYVTSYPTPDKDGNTITLADFDAHKSRQIDYNPEVEVIVQEGDKDGPSFGKLGYTSIEPNAVMRVRGNTSRGAKYKSFKIKLYDRAGDWYGQNTLNLNKHPYDYTKVANKFCYDYFEKLSDICGLKTKFVHLYIKDMSKPGNQRKFEDYGLYTHIEQPNKAFLKSHGLDEEGTIYKAKSFEFLRYSDKLRLESDPLYNKEVFESILEIREGKDHEKLLKMLEDVNNLNLDFNVVFDKYFNRDNYLTWMATNILFGNEDTVAQNFMLYNPKNSLTWYFTPWDYDGTLGYGEYTRVSAVPDSMYGIARYWGVILHKRFFRDPKNVEALTAKIEEITQTVVTAENTKTLVNSYKPVVNEFLYKMPDISTLRINPDEVNLYLDNYHNVIENNKSRYMKALKNPMPVFTTKPQKKQDGSYQFSWDTSYDIQGDVITYDFDIAKDYEFTQPVFSAKGISTTKITVSKLPVGRYYWRLIIRDDKGNMQYSFNNIKPSGSDRLYWGVSELIVR